MNFLQAPLKSVKRAARIFAGSDVYIRKQVDCRVIYLGNVGTCWPLCPEALVDRPLVYSFGVGEDVSFDLAPPSIAWVASQQLPASFHFHPCGIADRDGVCSFLPPANPAHVSHTMIARESASPRLELPVKRIGSFLAELQHSRIDLLKMDIEGAEYSVIDDLVASGIAVRQLLVEFHHRWKEVGLSKTRKAVRKLNAAGYRIFAVSPNGEEYGFLDSSARSVVVPSHSGLAARTGGV